MTVGMLDNTIRGQYRRETSASASTEISAVDAQAYVQAKVRAVAVALYEGKVNRRTLKGLADCLKKSGATIYNSGRSHPIYDLSNRSAAALLWDLHNTDRLKEDLKDEYALDPEDNQAFKYRRRHEVSDRHPLYKSMNKNMSPDSKGRTKLPEYLRYNTLCPSCVVSQRGSPFFGVFIIWLFTIEPIMLICKVMHFHFWLGMGFWIIYGLLLYVGHRMQRASIEKQARKEGLYVSVCNHHSR